MCRSIKLLRWPDQLATEQEIQEVFDAAVQASAAATQRGIRRKELHA